MFDLLLRNGRVVDGTGNPWFRADVGVVDGRIAGLAASLSGADAATVIDAGDRVVAPGFIDAHAHSDLRVLTDPTVEPKLRQGVTTEIVGQDGLSVAPVSDRNRASMAARLSGLLDVGDGEWPWTTVDGYLTAVAEARPAVNVAFLVPHGAVRSAVAGFEARALDPEETRRMQSLVEAGLGDGAVGVSTGLIYPPCTFADREELVALCRPAAGSGAPFVVHVRNESDHVVESMDEVLAVARGADVPLHVSHLKAAGRDNHAKLPAVLRRFEDARADREVTYDQYPYAAGSTFLSSLVPPWVHEGGTEEMLERLRDSTVRGRLARELDEPGRWENMVRACGWEGIRVAAVQTDANRWCEGRNLLEIADERSQPPADALFDLIGEERGQAMMVNFWGSEDLVGEAIAHPLQMVGSDGLFGGKPHPRLYGTFPRVLGPWVRNGTLRLEDAVRRMTSAAAQRFGLTGRGVVREGAWADLVVFDPDRVADRASYEDPHQFPDGIDDVVVNGVVTIRGGVLTGNRAGRPLRYRERTGRAAP